MTAKSLFCITASAAFLIFTSCTENNTLTIGSEHNTPPVIHPDDPECTSHKDCTNPSKPVCSDGKCIEDANTPECSSDDDCTNPSTPSCSNGKCIEAPNTPECSDDNDCTNPSKPSCSNGKCIEAPNTPECSDDSDCTDPSKPVCSNGNCVEAANTPECSDDNDCTDPSKPVCSNGNCIASPNTPECNNDNDCTDPSKPVCSNGNCVEAANTPECNNDNDCTDPSKPVCSNGNCIAAPKYKADIIDVVFNEDGTAQNIAPTSLLVESMGTAPTVTHHETLGINVATFSNTLGSTPSSYYRVDYSSNDDVKSKIADGHTLETVIKLGVNNDGSKATHFFSSTESGGTGFLVSKSDSGTSITFLPHVGGNYISVSSGVTPKNGIYYHVVGVYDKANEKALIYINGELKKSVDAKGDFNFGSEHWFGIAGDAFSNGAEAAWNGDIAIARVYSEPLSQDRIRELYQETKIDAIPVEIPFDLSDVDAIGSVRVSHGYKYYFYGKNFVDGDYVRFESQTTGRSFKANANVEPDRLVVIIPDDLVTDTYKSILVRGNRTAELAKGKIIVSPNAPRTTHPRIVAHMGDIEYKYANTDANSIANVKRAQDIDVYAIELDLRMSSDGVLVVYHDAKINGVSIASNTIATLEKQKLPNGEKLPRFSEFLDAAKQKPTVRLLVDVKYLSTIYEMIDKGIELVKSKGMEDQVDWLIEPYSICLKTKTRSDASPNATVMQLISGEGDINKNADMVADGIVPGYDYRLSSFYNKSVIDKAHAAGGIVAVWTPDTPELIDLQISYGVDAITTDLARTALGKVKVYAEPN